MKIQTLSVVVGTQACDADCPFCVSKQTGFHDLPKNRGINLRNLKKAEKLAKLSGTTTVLLTGKGEPVLYPEEIGTYVAILGKQFPFIELQTNGKQLGKLALTGKCDVAIKNSTLYDWYEDGLDTIALSAVDIDDKNNRQIYGDDYPGLAVIIQYLHQFGFSIRLCIMMHDGMIDRPEKVQTVIDFCREHHVAQLTIRPIRAAANSEPGHPVTSYVRQNQIDLVHLDVIQKEIQEMGTKLLSLSHGATVYDVNGQNVCLSDCLTLEPYHDDIRTMIFYSDGRIAYDWQYHGAVFLAPNK